MAKTVATTPSSNGTLLSLPERCFLSSSTAASRAVVRELRSEEACPESSPGRVLPAARGIQLFRFAHPKQRISPVQSQVNANGRRRERTVPPLLPSYGTAPDATGREYNSRLRRLNEDQPDRENGIRAGTRKTWPGPSRRCSSNGRNDGAWTREPRDLVRGRNADPSLARFVRILYLKMTNWCGARFSVTKRDPLFAVRTGTVPVPP